MKIGKACAQATSVALVAAGFTFTAAWNNDLGSPADALMIQQTTSTVQVLRNVIGDPSAHSVAVSQKHWAQGSIEAVVVEATDSYSIAVAGPLARSRNVPLLLASGDFPEAIQDELERLGSTNAILIGPGFSPRTLLRQAINSVVATQMWISGPGPDEMDSPVASLFSGTAEEIYLTDALDPTDLATASAASSFQKVPLFTVGNALTDWEKGELTRLKPQRVHFIGTTTTATQTVADVEALGIPMSPVSGDSAASRNETVVRSLRGRNLDDRALVIGSAAGSSQILISSFGASMDGTIPRVASDPSSLTGSIKEEASSWGPEVRSAVVIGPATVLSDSYLNQLQTAVLTPRSMAGAFHVIATDTNADGSGWVELSAQPNAAQYKLVDLAGTTVYSGTSPRFPVPADGTTFKASALDAAGSTLAERDVRVAINPDEIDSKTKVAATSDATMTKLEWSEGSAGPRARHITRHEMIRDAQGQLSIAGTTQLGGTCATSFTDASRPADKEIIYEVSQYGTNTDNFCSVPNPATSLREPQVDLTALRIPAAPSTATIQSESVSISGAPTPTMAERSLMELKAQSTSEALAPESFGTSAWTFRYQTFIADNYARPAWYDTQTFGGDNRGFGAWHNSFRTRADMTFYFDSRYQIQSMYFGKATGITKEYHCTLHSFNNCSFVKQAQASTDGIKIMDKRAYGSWRVARIEHDSVIPIQPHGTFWGIPPVPGITYTMDVLYWPNGFSVTGFHDGAPSHELWGGWVPGEYIPIMAHDRACDFGVGLAGFCKVNFNIKI